MFCDLKKDVEASERAVDFKLLVYEANPTVKTCRDLRQRNPKDYRGYSETTFRAIEHPANSDLTTKTVGSNIIAML